MYQQKICYIDLYKDGVKCGNMGHVRLEWEQGKYRFAANLCHMDRQTLVTAVMEHIGRNTGTRIQDIAIIHGKGKFQSDWLAFEGNEERILFEASGGVYGVCNLPHMEGAQQRDEDKAEEASFDRAADGRAVEAFVTKEGERAGREPELGEAERASREPALWKNERASREPEPWEEERAGKEPELREGEWAAKEPKPGEVEWVKKEPEPGEGERAEKESEPWKEERAAKELEPWEGKRTGEEPESKEIERAARKSAPGEIERAEKEPEPEERERAGKDTDPRGSQERRKHEWKAAMLLDDKWKQLCSMYPMVHPIGEDIDFLTISPEDFVILRQEYQGLVRNSFLLHGYYSYNHVLLGKYPDKYYIGVPGIMHEQERIAAAMFGFIGFERAKAPKGHQKDQDQFGYYMMEVGI